MTAATFDYDKWQKRFPELASVNSDLAQEYFLEACLEPLATRVIAGVSDPDTQLTYLNLLVAHIVKLNATINGVAPSGLVGQVKDASEGSVSVSVNVPVNMPHGADWFMQTRYGAQFWRLTAPYRTAVYRPNKRFMPSGGAFGGFG